MEDLADNSAFLTKVLTMSRKLIAVIATGFCLIPMAACAASLFSHGPKDIQVTSVTEVDFKDQPQLDWASLKPRPSRMMYRIEFTTNMDLLALAKRKDYNVAFDVGPCSAEGVKKMGGGYVYWNKLRIYSGTKEDSGYSAQIAKGPPYTYQVFAAEWELSAAPGSMCFTLSGGNMIGGTLRSNVAVIPNDRKSH